MFDLYEYLWLFIAFCFVMGALIAVFKSDWLDNRPTTEDIEEWNAEIVHRTRIRSITEPHDTPKVKPWPMVH